MSPLPMRDAIRKLVGRGGGTFRYEAAVVRCKLTPELASRLEISREWPRFIAGVVVGAELQCSVLPASAGHTVAEHMKLPTIDAAADDAVVSKIHCFVVHGDGFQLHVRQKGGPPVDPAKLQGLREEPLAKAIEAWRKTSLAWPPSTWEQLYVLGNDAPSPGAKAAKNRKSNLPVDLAATASVDLRIEPAQMGSLGAAHAESLKRIFEGDVAGVLGISPQQVLCGAVERGLPGMAVRGDAVRLHFAILDAALAEERKRRLAPPGIGGLPQLALSGVGKTLQMQQQNMSKTFSAPSLHGAYGSTGLQPLITDALLGNSSGGTLSGPSVLMGRFLKLAARSKLPAHVRGGAFPMLAKLQPHTCVVYDVISGSPEGVPHIAGEERAKKGRTGASVQDEALLQLSQARLRCSSFAPGVKGAALAAAREKVKDMIPRDLLVTLEASMAKQASLEACLDELAERTSNGPVQCRAHATHGAVHLLYQGIVRMANSRRLVDAMKSLSILVNFAIHDPESLDAELSVGIPALLDALGKLQSEIKLQCYGLRLIERLFENARASKRANRTNRRVLTLGHGLDEAFTFRILAHIFSIMRTGERDCDLQRQSVSILAPLGDALIDGALALDAFTLVAAAARRHPRSAELATSIVQLMGRLGPAFLSREPKSVMLVVMCLERHRSNADVQHAGAKALARLCAGGGDTQTVRLCRSSGSVAAMILAACAHSSDQQLLREVSKVLDILCPGAMAVIQSLSSELHQLLAPMRWGVDPFRTADDSPFDLTSIKASGQFGKGIVETFEKEVLATRHAGRKAGAEELGDCDALLQLEGYARNALRDQMSFPGDHWPLPGRGAMLPNSTKGKYAQELRERDMIALQNNNCDTSSFLVPGPEKRHIHKLCTSLKHAAEILPDSADQLRKGIAGSPDSALVRRGSKGQPVPVLLQVEDAECLLSLLAFYAWCSPAHARDVYIEEDGANTIVTWLQSPCFSMNNAKNCRSADDEQLLRAAFPMQRACLSAFSALCRHDPAGATAVLGAKGGAAILEFVGHMDPGVRCEALRCSARLVPHAGRGGQMDAELLWPAVVAGLRASEHEALRLAAGASALAALTDGWGDLELDPPPPIQGLMLGLKVAMMQATGAGSAEGLLPLLLCMRLLLDSDSHVKQFRDNPEGMLRALPQWLPHGAKQGSNAIERVVALAAAEVMEKCYTRKLVPSDVKLDTEDTVKLLHTGASDYAEPSLARACDMALIEIVRRETEVTELEFLLATPPQKSSGGDKLPAAEVLQNVAARITELVRKKPAQASETLKAVVDRTESLFMEEIRDSSETMALERIRELKSQLASTDLSPRSSRRRRSSRAGWIADFPSRADIKAATEALQSPQRSRSVEPPRATGGESDTDK